MRLESVGKLTLSIFSSEGARIFCKMRKYVGRKVNFGSGGGERGAKPGMRRRILFTLHVGEVIALKTAHVWDSSFAN